MTTKEKLSKQISLLFVPIFREVYLTHTAAFIPSHTCIGDAIPKITLSQGHLVERLWLYPGQVLNWTATEGCLAFKCMRDISLPLFRQDLSIKSNFIGLFLFNLLDIIIFLAIIPQTGTFFSPSISCQINFTVDSGNNKNNHKPCWVTHCGLRFDMPLHGGILM